MKKALLSVLFLFGVVILPTTSLAAGGLVVTPVSAGLHFKYVSSTTPLAVVGSHVIKVKAVGGKMYLGAANMNDLISTSGKPSGNAIDGSIITNASTTDKSSGMWFYILEPGVEYQFTYSGTWNSGTLFQGSYYSKVDHLEYFDSIPLAGNYSPLFYPLNQRSNTLAVVGEKSPYITAINPNSSDDSGRTGLMYVVNKGGSVYLTGERLSGNTPYIRLYNGAPIGPLVQLPVITATNSFLQTKLPASLQSGDYLIDLRGVNGNSNPKVILVGTTTYRDAIYAVEPRRSASTTERVTSITQGTNIGKVDWGYYGDIPYVDVMVCTDTNACFYAYNKVFNTGIVTNVRVGTNIPASTSTISHYAYIKVRKAGSDIVMATSSQFRVNPAGGAVGVNTSSVNSSQLASAISTLEELLAKLKSVLAASK
jgi:hypothetical protein